MNRKHLICLILITTMLFVMTGCGTKESGNDTSSSESTEQSADASNNRTDIFDKEYLDFMVGWVWQQLKTNVKNDESRFTDQWKNSKSYQYASTFENAKLSDFDVYHFCYDDRDKALEQLLTEDVMKHFEEVSVDWILPVSGHLFFFCNGDYHFVGCVANTFLSNSYEVEKIENEKGVCFWKTHAETSQGKVCGLVQLKSSTCRWVEAYLDISKGYYDQKDYKNATSYSKQAVIWSGLWVTAPFAEESDTFELYKWQKLPRDRVAGIENVLTAGTYKFPSYDECQEMFSIIFEENNKQRQAG